MARATDKQGRKGAGERSTASFSARHNDLRNGMPVSLRQAPPSREQFAHARDPLVSRQLRDEGKTEAQRREESGDQRAKVLKTRFPKNAPTGRKPEPARKPFNREAMQAIREQRFAEYETQRAERREQVPDYGQIRSYRPSR